MEVRVTKRAQRHIDRAALWWDQNRPLAPEALDEELAEAFSLLSTEPGIGAPALNVRAKGVCSLCGKAALADNVTVLEGRGVLCAECIDAVLKAKRSA